jgi:hypothetical protein
MIFFQKQNQDYKKKKSKQANTAFYFIKDNLFPLTAFLRQIFCIVTVFPTVS